jgi:hypothetical protein
MISSAINSYYTRSESGDRSARREAPRFVQIQHGFMSTVSRQQTRWTISFSDLVLGARLEDQAARPSLRSTRGRSTGTQRSLATPTARCLDPVFQCQRCHCSIPFFSSSIPPAGGGPKKRAEPDAPGAGRIRRELPALTAKKRSGGWAREGWLRRPRR